jgi:hypothetical protein
MVMPVDRRRSVFGDVVPTARGFCFARVTTASMAPKPRLQDFVPGAKLPGTALSQCKDLVRHAGRSQERKFILTFDTIAENV